MVPFVHVPTIEDHELELKLREEAPEILQWMIDGCLAWQEAGAFPYAEAVVQSTGDYLHDQDNIGQFIEQCCHSNSMPLPTDLPANQIYRTASRLLYRGYVLFCESRGEQVGSEKRFIFELEKKGYQRARDKVARKIVGLCLTNEVEKRVGAMVDGL